MPVVGVWRGGYEIVFDDGRTHRVTVDLPAESGGRSVGTSSFDLILMALAGSIGTTFLAHARRQGMDVEGLSVALEEDPNGPTGATGRIRGTVRARTRSASATVEELLRSSLRAAPVGALLERAGVAIELRAVTESPPAVPRR